MTDPLITLFPPVPHDDEAERAARAHGLAALREAAAREPEAGRAEAPRGRAEAPQGRAEAPQGRAEVPPGRAEVPRDRPAAPRNGALGRRGRRHAAARRARPRRRWLLAPAALAAVASAIVVALTSGVDEGRLGPANSAAALLTRAADGAGRSPAVGALAPGQYLYVKRTETDRRTGAGFVVDQRAVYEDWTSRDGSGRSRSRPEAPAFPTPADRAAWKRAGSPLPERAERADHSRPAWPEHAFPSWVGSQAVSYAQARALPTDPAALERALRTQAKTQGTTGIAALRLFERIASLLAGAPLDPGQRAALYRVTAHLPGVRVDADTVLPGASAVSAQADVDGSHYRVTMVFDPATGRLLAIRTLVTGRITIDHRVRFDLAVRRSTDS